MLGSVTLHRVGDIDGASRRAEELAYQQRRDQAASRRRADAGRRSTGPTAGLAAQLSLHRRKPDQCPFRSMRRHRDRSRSGGQGGRGAEGPAAGLRNLVCGCADTNCAARAWMPPSPSRSRCRRWRRMPTVQILFRRRRRQGAGRARPGPIFRIPPMPTLLLLRRFQLLHDDRAGTGISRAG